MKENVLAEILDWSKTLPEWQRDALRRVFVSGSTTADDVRELAELCKAAHGLSSSRCCDAIHLLTRSRDVDDDLAVDLLSFPNDQAGSQRGRESRRYGGSVPAFNRVGYVQPAT